jgi:hypothetical protein
LKLDVIIKSIDKAHNGMIDIENLSDVELQQLADKYQKIREDCDTTEPGAENLDPIMQEAGLNDPELDPTISASRSMHCAIVRSGSGKSVNPEYAGGRSFTTNSWMR